MWMWNSRLYMYAWIYVPVSVYIIDIYHGVSGSVCLSSRIYEWRKGYALQLGYLSFGISHAHQFIIIVNITIWNKGAKKSIQNISWNWCNTAEVFFKDGS